MNNLKSYRSRHVQHSPWVPVFAEEGMAVRFHPHAKERIQERGATEDEAALTVEYRERFPARFGQVEVYAVQEGADWLVITVITRYF